MCPFTYCWSSFADPKESCKYFPTGFYMHINDHFSWINTWECEMLGHRLDLLVGFRICFKERLFQSSLFSWDFLGGDLAAEYPLLASYCHAVHWTGWKVFKLKLLLMVELGMTLVINGIFALLVAIPFPPLWPGYSKSMVCEACWLHVEHVRNSESQAPRGVMICIRTGFPVMGVDMTFEKHCSGAYGRTRRRALCPWAYPWVERSAAQAQLGPSQVLLIGFRYSGRRE